ncbi:MAG TPA: DUF4397 domain-containing protein, partial [Frankiaceae bacterium]|nr:DUF4397 domain-containing protein [Frankiaceae bacterium]
MATPRTVPIEEGQLVSPTPLRARRTVRLAAAAGVAAVVAVPLLAGSASAAATGTVYVVHGVPGLPVDVYVNGKLTLPDFRPKTVTSPLSLPAGTYQIAIRKAGAPPSSAPAISGSANLAAGANVSLVAHLTAAGSPTLTAFVNDTGGIPAGRARVIVRHTAAAPAVDVLAGGSPVVKGLTNPDQKSLDVPAGSVTASVALAGTTTPVLGPATLDLAAGSTTVVYAIGSAKDKTLALLTQSVHHGPSSAKAGTGGQAADRGGANVPLVALLGLSGAGLLAVLS